MNKIPLFLIQLYRSLNRGGNCKFVPSCSEYGLLAYKRHSFIKATWLTFSRIMRCHPWRKMTHDPLPDCEGVCRCDKIAE